MRRSTVAVALTATFTFLIVGACGGSTTETKDGTGGSGGKIVDSSTPEVGADVMVEAGPDVTAEAAPDVSLDAPTDQSVEPETSVMDGEVIEGSLFDLEMPDVLLNESGATLQGCYDCAVASCSSEMETCEQDDKCRTILLCLFDDQCFGGANGIDYGCGMSCATKAGISGMGDPAVSIALAAGQCISGACPEDCGVPKDGG